MSYSFSVTAPSKADAIDQITQKMIDTVAQQPNHAADKDAAIATATAFVSILADPQPGQVVDVSVYGSLGWSSSDPTAYSYISATIGVSASIKALT